MDAEVTEWSGRTPINKHRSWRMLALAAVLAGLAGGASACGGAAALDRSSGSSSPTSAASSPSPNVTTTTTLTTLATNSLPAQQLTTKLLQYARCMRSHGVSDYPDPIASGSAPQSNPIVRNFASNSPVFQKAEQACRKYAVGQPASSATETAKLVAKLLEFVDCMRSHGVPDFPDPSSTGGLTIPNSIDQNSPPFKRADHACSSLLPAGSPTMSPA